MTASARGGERLVAIPRHLSQTLKTLARLGIPLVGFVFHQREEGSRSLQAEGTGCEIGCWQVNEVFRRCEKAGSIGGWGKGRRSGKRGTQSWWGEE